MFSQASEKSPSSTPPLYTSGQRQIGLVSDLWSRWAQASAMAVTLLSMYIACYSLARCYGKNLVINANLEACGCYLFVLWWCKPHGA